ncbi:MAG TPA: LEA type 2 family protein [Myxococcota bacterium]|nr:LEA type 2 family protein [Myxococcota bacterium]HQK50974.1 LEA type 2 family protein [Myxococcota bacterium]
MSRRIGVGIVALLVLGLGTGCNALQKRLAFANTRFELKSVGLRSVDLSGVTFEVRLEVFNPNDIAALLDGMNVDFGLDGRSLVSMSSTQRVNVPARERRAMSLDLRVGISTIAGMLQHVRSAVPKTYHVRGVAFFDTDIGRFDVPVNLTGQFR